ncbi:MAG: hypothetical protein ACJAS3_003695 [Roseivirga sp.]
MAIGSLFFMRCDEANGYDWELNLLCRLHYRTSAGLNQLRSIARKQVQQLKMSGL